MKNIYIRIHSHIHTILIHINTMAQSKCSINVGHDDDDYDDHRNDFFLGLEMKL